MDKEKGRALELSIEQAKEKIELKDCLDRLFNNKDFKKIINEGYFKDEAVRLVHLKSDPNSQNEEDQNAIMSAMDSIGYLRQHFIAIRQLGDMASKALKEDEKTREAMLAEEL